MAQAVKAKDAGNAKATIAGHLAAEGMAPLAGCTPESLAGELLEHGEAWDIGTLGAKLAPRPVLLITSDDGSQPASDALAAGLRKAGDGAVTQVHMATDHPVLGPPHCA